MNLPFFQRGVGIFAIALLAYLVGAGCLVGLAWDGSGYFFNSLQMGEPVISHHRYSNYFTLWSVVQAGRWVEDSWTLGVFYSALLALTPLISLALSLWFLRGPQLAPLRIWPVLGILPGALPGEICLMSEASLTVQAFWPILAFVAAGVPAGGLFWVGGLSLYLFFLHPTSALLFFLAAMLAGALAWEQSAIRAKAFTWSALWLVLALARLGFSLQTATPYERGELGWEANWQAFLGSLFGLPLGLLGCLYLFGLAYLAGSTGGLVPARSRRIALGAALAFMVIGLVWAADSTLWAGAIGYRRFIFLSALPLIVMGGFHRFWLRRAGSELSWSGVFPPSTVAGVAAGFALIFMVQSLTWRADVIRFQTALTQAPGPWVTRAELPWMKGRALDHWSSSMLSAIVQGRSPRAIYAENWAHVKGDDLELFPGGWLLSTDAWFRLAPESRSRP